MKYCIVKWISALFLFWTSIIIFVLYLNLIEINQFKFEPEINTKKVTLKYTNNNQYSSISTPKFFNNSKNFVLISIDINSNKDYYMFILPYTTVAWRRLNYEPILFFITEQKNLSSKKQKQLRKTTQYLSFLNVTILKVPSHQKYPFMVPMIIRLFSGILPDNLVNDNDFVITSDADLIPVNEKYYIHSSKNSIIIWNAFCCKPFKFKSMSIF
jgi:hypothetical protein